CLQMLEEPAMPVLCRAMAEDAVSADARVHFGCEQGRDAHREAVDDHDATMPCDFEHRARQHRELDAAELHQRFEWRQYARTARRGFRQHLALACQSRVVEASTPPAAIDARTRGPHNAH